MQRSSSAGTLSRSSVPCKTPCAEIGADWLGWLRTLHAQRLQSRLKDPQVRAQVSDLVSSGSTATCFSDDYPLTNAGRPGERSIAKLGACAARSLSTITTKRDHQQWQRRHPMVPVLPLHLLSAEQQPARRQWQQPLAQASSPLLTKKRTGGGFGFNRSPCRSSPDHFTLAGLVTRHGHQLKVPRGAARGTPGDRACSRRVRLDGEVDAIHLSIDTTLHKSEALLLEISRFTLESEQTPSEEASDLDCDTAEEHSFGTRDTSATTFAETSVIARAALRATVRPEQQRVRPTASPSSEPHDDSECDSVVTGRCPPLVSRCPPLASSAASAGSMEEIRVGVFFAHEVAAERPCPSAASPQDGFPQRTLHAFLDVPCRRKDDHHACSLRGISVGLVGHEHGGARDLATASSSAWRRASSVTASLVSGSEKAKSSGLRELSRSNYLRAARTHWQLERDGGRWVRDAAASRSEALASRLDGELAQHRRVASEPLIVYPGRRSVEDVESRAKRADDDEHHVSPAIATATAEPQPPRPTIEVAASPESDSDEGVAPLRSITQNAVSIQRQLEDMEANLESALSRPCTLASSAVAMVIAAASLEPQPVHSVASGDNGALCLTRELDRLRSRRFDDDIARLHQDCEQLVSDLLEASRARMAALDGAGDR